MTKKDWIEYFELVNDREPSAEELLTALENGEYTTQATQTSQVKENEAEARSAQPLISQEQQDRIKSEASTFWKWIVSSLKAPVEGAKGDQVAWYGWAIIGLLSLFSGLALGMITYISVNAAIIGLSDYTDTYIPTATSGVGRSMFMGTLFMFLVIITTIFAGWVARRGILGNKNFSFKRAVDYYGRLYVPLMFLIIIIFLFSLLRIVTLSMILTFLAIAVWGFISYFAILNARSEHKGFDTFYAMMLAVFVNFLIVILITAAVILPLFGEAVLSIFS